MTTIADRLQRVRERIQAACAADSPLRASSAPPASRPAPLRALASAGLAAPTQPANAVQLLAVSKAHPAEDVRAAAAAGQRAFGENYIQEAVDKMAQLADLPLVWHCIGPIQSNKARLVAEHFDWVHTVDRMKIAERLSELRPAARGELQVLIQVNIDGGPHKSGVSPDDALALARAVAPLPRLRLRGIMAIPEPAPDFEAQFSIHTREKALFDHMKKELGASTLDFDTLSIGMSDDLEAAVAAGSTLVRVGTAIFGPRPKPPANA